MEIRILDATLEAAYDAFLLRGERTTIKQSNVFRKVLKRILDAEDRYLLAVDNHGTIRGALPAFVHRNDACGAVLNSLPFFGSNGGVIRHDGDEDVARLLLEAFDELAREYACASATIVGSPGDDESLYERLFPHQYTDERIAMVSGLRGEGSPEEYLRKGFASSLKRNLAKAARSGVEVVKAAGAVEWAFFEDGHRKNMERKGGTPRPSAYFEAIRAEMKEGRDYKLYTARMDGEPVGALLSFFFNRTVHYGVPVTRDGFGEFQPASRLIFQAMIDAAEEGYAYWNWGGTWKSQTGVYQFKKKWGGEESVYRYYTRDYDLGRYMAMEPAAILRAAPYFFVLPFDALDGAGQARRPSHGE